MDDHRFPVGRSNMEEIDWDDRVHLGAERLDTARPGWEKEIDLDLLAIWDGARCILGQLYLEFTEGMIQLDLLGIRQAAVFGFTVPGFDYEMSDWDALNDAWRKLIRERIADRPDQGC